MSRPFTVLQMLPALESGGVERGTLEMAHALVQAGHRSLVMSGGGRLVKRLVEEGSEHYPWSVGRKSPWSLRLVPRLRRFLAEQRVDILHVRSRMPAWIAWLAWRGMDPRVRPRFVTTVHGLYSVNRYSGVMTRGERVICVSETARDYVLNNYPGVDSARLRVIPRGVDPRAFPHGYRPPEAWYRDAPHLLERHVLSMVGRLSRLKGHEDFIELISRLRATGLNVHGLIVGGEEPGRAAYARALRQRVVDLGLEDRVSFLGQRGDVREIYAASDLVLSLSRRPESFGRTVLEALSLGVPVVGYAEGGVGEVLEKLYPVGKVAAGDLAAAEKRVSELLLRPEPVPRDHPFTLARMVADTLKLYAELVGHGEDDTGGAA